ncbi:MAG: hypothetical protein KH847_06465, partial [Clostridiales bacterium]|nr:hypothetical protein [Clostridiales bacterium]
MGNKLFHDKTPKIKAKIPGQGRRSVEAASISRHILKKRTPAANQPTGIPPERRPGAPRMPNDKT